MEKEQIIEILNNMDKHIVYSQATNAFFFEACLVQARDEAVRLIERRTNEKN